MCNYNIQVHNTLSDLNPLSSHKSSGMILFLVQISIMHFKSQSLQSQLDSCCGISQFIQIYVLVQFSHAIDPLQNCFQVVHIFTKEMQICLSSCISAFFKNHIVRNTYHSRQQKSDDCCHSMEQKERILRQQTPSTSSLSI